MRAELFGSLGATGRGHGSDRAVILGLEGEDPETVDTAAVEARASAVRASGSIRLLGEHEAALTKSDLVLNRRQSRRKTISQDGNEIWRWPHWLPWFWQPSGNSASRISH